MNVTLQDKTKHYRNYADVVHQQYRQIRYGLKSCAPVKDADLLYVRKELLDWMEKADTEALATTSIQFRTYLPVQYNNLQSPTGATGAVVSGQSPNTTSVSFNYPGAGSQNIIEISAGGCITRINLNALININNNTGFEFTQSTPSAVWDIIHPLTIKPGVTLEDLDGNDLEGLIEYVSSDHVRVLFSQPVAGKAYLS